MSTVAENLKIVQDSLTAIKAAIKERGAVIEGNITTYARLIGDIQSNAITYFELPFSELLKIYPPIYYDSLEVAIADINNDSVAGNSDAENASVLICKGQKQYFVYMLKSAVINTTLTLNNVRLVLNGNTIESTSPLLFSLQNNNTIDGSTPNSIVYFHPTEDSLVKIAEVVGTGNEMIGGKYNIFTNGNGTYPDNPEILVSVIGELRTDNIALSCEDKKGGTIRAFQVEKDGKLEMDDSLVTVTSQTGLHSCCVHVVGVAHFEECTLNAYSNHCANEAGNDYGQTSRAVFSEVDSEVMFKNCYIYGAHSGATIKGKLSVLGGVYRGYSHGGFYLTNTECTTYIKDAVIMETPLFGEFYDDGIAGTNQAGMYTGAAINMRIYMDNCMVYGVAQPIVLKYSASSSHDNHLYISNSAVNKDYTHYAIRNDGANYVFFGINNNLDNTDLKYDQNYEFTEEDYGTVIESNWQ